MEHLRAENENRSPERSTGVKRVNVKKMKIMVSSENSGKISEESSWYFLQIEFRQ